MKNDLIKIGMPIFEGKRIKNVTAKIKESQKDALQEVCDLEDRTMSYVLGELAVRGLALYKQDGELKATAAEEKIIANGNKVSSATKAKQESKTQTVKPKTPAAAGLNFSGKTSTKSTNKQKEAELNKQMDKAVADMRKESKK